MSKVNKSIAGSLIVAASWLLSSQMFWLQEAVIE